MTVEECYRAFGGDYEGTIDRLVTEELVTKYLITSAWWMHSVPGGAGTGKLFRLSTH